MRWATGGHESETDIKQTREDKSDSATGQSETETGGEKEKKEEGKWHVASVPT